MKNTRLMCLAIALCIITASNSAPTYGWGGHGHHGHRHHGHSHLGIGLGYFSPGFYGNYGFGGYSFGSPFYYPPYYSYPQPVIVPATPPIYIQQQPPSPKNRYWYYCQNSNGYYPYVKDCPEGWLQVAPKPPG